MSCSKSNDVYYPQNESPIKTRTISKSFLLSGCSLTKYQVDQIDSLNALNEFLDPSLKAGNDVRKARFNETEDGGMVTSNFIMGEGLCINTVRRTYKDDFKKINLHMVPTSCFKKDIFYGADWRILHYPVNNDPSLRIHAHIDGRHYNVEIRP